MADDEAQGQEDISWWAFDASADSSLPSASFDEPLVWPEAASWEEPATVEPSVEPIAASEHPADLDGGLLFPPESDDAAVAAAPLPDLDVEWQATGHDDDVTVLHSEPLAGLGGGARSVVPAALGASGEPLPESVWAEPARSDSGIGLISTSAHPTPAVYPAAERGADVPFWRRFDLRQGNAAMIGLISLVSLVLLGMFLSVRARNDVPTDTSQSRRPSNEIAVTGPLNTVPLTTTVTTTPASPTPAINIADLLPPTDAGAAAAGSGTGTPAASGSGGSGSGSGGSGSGGSGSGSGGSGSGGSATTAAPSRGSGGSSGGAGGSSTPAAQPAASSPSPTQPPATSPPQVEDTTPATSPPVETTQPRRTPTSITYPSIPSVSIPSNTSPSFTIPGWFADDD